MYNKIIFTYKEGNWKTLSVQQNPTSVFDAHSTKIFALTNL